MSCSPLRAFAHRSRGGRLVDRISQTVTVACALVVVGITVPEARAEKLMFLREGFTISSYDISGTNGSAMQASQTSLVTGTAGVTGMAWNVGANALYTLVPGDKSIKAVTLTGSQTTAVGSTSWDTAGLGTTGFFNIAINAAGDMFFCDLTNGRIMKSTPQGVISTYATGLSNPYDVTVDPTSGKVWFAEPFNNRIGSIDGGSVTFTSIASPRGIVFDSTGSGYIIQDTNQITKMLANGSMSTFATFSGFGTAGIGRDNNDRIFALVRGDAMQGQPNTLRIYDPSGTEITSFTTRSTMMAVPPVAVPEPSAIALTGLGALTLGCSAVIRRRCRAPTLS